LTIVNTIAGTAVATALGVGLALGVTNAPLVPSTPTAVAQPQSDNPPCGYDVYRKALTVTSLTAKGTVRVILWKDLGYRWHGQPVRQGTLVRTSKIKKGQTVTYRLKRKHTADEFTVDIVRGKLTKEDTPNGKRRVSECEAA
jgi:hypothetical protein